MAIFLPSKASKLCLNLLRPGCLLQRAPCSLDGSVYGNNDSSFWGSSGFHCREFGHYKQDPLQECGLEHGWRLLSHRGLTTEKGFDEYSDEQLEDDAERRFLDVPGGKFELTYEMNFISESSNKRVPCYRVLNEVGCHVSTDARDNQPAIGH